jgi:hypothetical protein
MLPSAQLYELFLVLLAFEFQTSGSDPLEYGSSFVYDAGWSLILNQRTQDFLNFVRCSRELFD